MLDIEQTDLFQKLVQGKSPNRLVYAGKLKENVALLHPILEYTKRIFPHYTSHSIDHSIEIIYQLGRILPKSVINNLTGIELFLLMSGALFHDSGMVVSQRENDELVSNANFRDFYNENYKSRIEIERSRVDNNIELIDALVSRFLISEFYRKKHHERSAELVFNFAPFLDPANESNSPLVLNLAKICACHGYAVEALEDDENYPMEIEIEHEKANIKFLACCLRIGDLLDMSNERYCPLVVALVSPMPFGSIEQWTRHQLDLYNVSSKKITIRKKCRNQDEHRILFEWIGWLKKELEHTGAMLGHYDRLKFVAPKLDAKPESDGTYVFENYKFEIEAESIFNTIIGERIYSERNIFLRELIQNSVDALRCRCLIEYSREKNMNVADIAILDIPPVFRNKYEVVITTGSVTKGGKEYKYFEVKDNGIGMTDEIIRKYFLKVGKSYYRSPEFYRTFSFKSLSYFGIGFLSCFMVSNYIEVETCSLIEPERAIQLEIPRWSGYFITRPSTVREPGTRVRVYVDPDFGLIERSTVKGKEAVKIDLSIVVSLWISHVEFPIKVREKHHPEHDFIDSWANEVPSGIRLDGENDIIHIHNIGEFLKKPSRGFIAVTKPNKKNYKKLWLSQEGFTITTGSTLNNHVTAFLNNIVYSGHIINYDLDLRGEDSLPLTLDKDNYVKGKESLIVQSRLVNEVRECLEKTLDTNDKNGNYTEQRNLISFILTYGRFIYSNRLFARMSDRLVFEGCINGVYKNYSISEIRSKVGNCIVIFRDLVSENLPTVVDEYLIDIKKNGLSLEDSDPIRDLKPCGDFPFIVMPNTTIKMPQDPKNEQAIEPIMELPLWYIDAFLGLNTIMPLEKIKRTALTTSFTPGSVGKSPFSVNYQNIFVCRLYNHWWLLNTDHPNGRILKDKLEILGISCISDPSFTKSGAILFKGNKPIWCFEVGGKRGVDITGLNESLIKMTSNYKDVYPDLANLRAVSSTDFFKWDIL